MQRLELAFRGLDDEMLPDYEKILTSTRRFDLSTQIALGCQCNGKPCGLAVVRPVSQSSAELVWIEVRGGLRRRGIGKALLAEMEKILAAAGTLQITAAFSEASLFKSELEPFLEICGFCAPVPTQKLFLAGIEDMRSTIDEDKAALLPQMKNQVFRLTELPVMAGRSLHSAVASGQIPDFVLPQNATGELLSDYSLACADAANVYAVVMYTALDGMLYLNALYIDRNHRLEGSRLMIYSLKRALDNYRGADVIAVNAINVQSNALVNYFAERVPHDSLTRLAMRKNLNRLEK